MLVPRFVTAASLFCLFGLGAAPNAVSDAHAQAGEALAANTLNLSGALPTGEPLAAVDVEEFETSAVLDPNLDAAEIRSDGGKPNTDEPAAPAAVVMSETFEGAFPNTWTLYGDPTWGDELYRPRSGSWSGWCAGAGYVPGSSYPNNMSSWMVKGPFNLGGANAASLDFYVWNDSEPNYDYFKWMASTDGSNFYGYQISGDTGGYTSRTLDLSAVPTLGNLLGLSQVWIAFQFTSDVSNSDYGSFVDDVTLNVSTATRDFASVGMELRTASGGGGSVVENPAVGQTVYPTFYWNHVGSGSVSVSTRIQLDGVTMCGGSESLAPGSWITTCPSVPWVVTAGVHTVTGGVDYTNTVSETNESNNTSTRQYTAVDSRDFAAVAIELRTASGGAGTLVNNPVAGQTLYPTFYWNHVGSGSVGVPVRVQVDGVTLCSGTETLAPGSWITTCPSNPWVAVAGTRTVTATLDYASAVVETNESNNTTTRNYSVSSGIPDIRILPTSLSISQTSGSSVTASSDTTIPLGPAAETEEISTTKKEENLVAKAEEHGNVRIIAQLRVSGYTAEGALSAVQTQSQRSAIASAQDTVLQSLGTEVLHSTPFETIPFLALDVTGPGLDMLLGSPAVVTVEEDVPNKPSLASSGPVVGAPTAWSNGYTGQGQTVAILDTGVDKTHPYLTATGAKVVSEACYSSNTGSLSVCPGGVTTSTASGSGVPCGISGCSHGTHVAGIAAGNDGVGPNIGIAKQANIIAVQVFSRFTGSDCAGDSDPCVRTWESDWIKGAERVYALRSTYNIAAVNMSFGGGSFASTCDGTAVAAKAIIDTLRSVGIASVIATGNEGLRTGVGRPACVSTAISVGATTDSDSIAEYSNIASFVSLLAPGSDITSSIPGGSTSAYYGTSMATPHVVGAWAVMKQRTPTATVTEIRDALRDTGVVLPDLRVSGSVTGLRRIRLGQATAGGGSFTIHNDGSGTLNVSGITRETSAPWITWTPAAPFSVPPGGQQAITVSIDYSLAPSGTTSRRLLVASNDPDENPYPNAVNITVTKAGTCGNGTVETGEQCDDSNQANGDCCSSVCQRESNGATCNDGLYCNGADTCNTGVCSNHLGSPCPGADGDSNCAESCNEAGDSCTAADPTGSSCNDGVYCNGTDTCSSGTCVVHTGNPCPGADGDSNCAESCNETSDFCNAADANGSPCNDGTFCNGADTCSSGSCSGHAGSPCPGADNDANCAESCNESTDVCTLADPNGSPCNDGLYCNGADTCSGGSCSTHVGSPCTGGAVCNESSDSCGNCVTLSLPATQRCSIGKDCSVAVGINPAGNLIAAASARLSASPAATCTSSCTVGTAASNGSCSINSSTCGFNVADLSPPITQFGTGEIARVTMQCSSVGNGQVCLEDRTAGSVLGVPVAVCGSASCAAFECTSCLPGDCNQTGSVEASDPICSVLCLLGQAPVQADCGCSADCNCLGGTEASDPVCTVLRVIGSFTPDSCVGAHASHTTRDVDADLKVKTRTNDNTTRSVIAIRGSDSNQVASVRVVVDTSPATRGFRLARRLRTRGFQLEQDREPGRTHLLVTPPAELPIAAIESGPVLRVKGAQNMRLAATEYGSVEGLPLTSAKGVDK